MCPPNLINCSLYYTIKEIKYNNFDFPCFSINSNPLKKLKTVQLFLSLHISFTGELPYPQLSLTSSSPLHPTLGTHGMNTPNTCSVVLVAGSALNNLKAVMEKVDSLVQDMLKIPYMVVLLVENQNMTQHTTRHAMSPAVVSFHSCESSVSCFFLPPFPLHFGYKLSVHRYKWT